MKHDCRVLTRSPYIFAFLMCWGLFLNAVAQPIECPATQTTELRTDFASSDCREIDLQNYVMSDSAVWLHIPLGIAEDLYNSDIPLALFVSGNLSLDAYINGHYIGSKGKPSNNSETEIAGVFDWVGYLPRGKIDEKSNTLTLFASSHANLFTRSGFFNRFYVAEFDNTTHSYKMRYAPSLVPLGAMLIALLYLLNQRYRVNTQKGNHQVNRRVSALFILLLVIAIAQLSVEISRGFYNYAYPLHFPRLVAIAGLAFLFGHCLLLCALNNVSLRIKTSLVLTSALATLALQYVVQDYDYKAIVGIQVPTTMGILVMLHSLMKRNGLFTSHAKQYLFVMFSLLLISSISQHNFLDAYFYFFIAVLLMILAKFESDHSLKMEYSLVELQQQARNLALALSVTSESGESKNIKVKSAGKVNLVASSAIQVCRAAGDYVELVCENETLLYSGNLKQIQQELPASFLKVHRSYLVNAKYIKSLHRLPSGNGELQLRSKARVPVSRALFAQIKHAVTYCE